MVYIVLVNWNGCRDTIECLESLLRLEGTGYRIIICDNASSDGSIERICDWGSGRSTPDMTGPPWPLLPAAVRKNPAVAVIGENEPLRSDDDLITVIRVGDNRGFAGANNIGAAHALADSRMTHVWFLNNDTVVHPQALGALLRKSSEDKRIGICGATLFYYDFPELVQGVGVKFDLLTGRGRIIGWKAEQASLPNAKAVEAAASYIIGASMFVTREFLETVGPMSEDYFLFFEELDWAYRNAGRFRMVWAPDAIVYHKEGASIGTKAGGRADPTATYYQSVNLLRFVKKYRTAILPLIVTKTLYVAMRYCVRQDWGNARVVALAVRDFVTGAHRRGKVT